MLVKAEEHNSAELFDFCHICRIILKIKYHVNQLTGITIFRWTKETPLYVKVSHVGTKVYNLKIYFIQYIVYTLFVINGLLCVSLQVTQWTFVPWQVSPGSFKVLRGFKHQTNLTLFPNFNIFLLKSRDCHEYWFFFAIISTTITFSAACYVLFS